MGGLAKWAVVVAVALGVGVAVGRDFHPLFWARGERPALTPDTLQQARLSAQLSGAVYLFGDSQIEGFATQRFAPNSANFGVAGDSAAGLAARLPSYDFRGARVVVIEVGDNDWGWGRFAHFAEGYRRALAAVPPNIPIVAVATPPPARGWRFGAGPTPEAIAAANRSARALCTARVGCRFVEPALAGPDGYLKPGMDVDGEHLSAAGYATWRAALAPSVAAAEVAQRVGGR